MVDRGGSAEVDVQVDEVRAVGARYVQASRAATLAMSRIGAATTRRFANRWVMGAAGA